MKIQIKQWIVGFLLKQLKRKTIPAWTASNAPLGTALGYPECCIKGFCQQPPELMKVVKPSETDKLRLKAAYINDEFSGFIPCAKHAKMILAKEISLSELIQDRTISIPFPNY